MDMEMEEWTATGRGMVGRYDKTSRLDDEWEFNLCQLIAVISSHAEPESDVYPKF